MRVKPGTAQQYALMPWAFLRHQYKLQDRLPPNALRMALDTGVNEDEKKLRRIPDEHFLAVLARCKGDPMYQSLLWVLWDTGFRISEALSLNVGSVTYEDGGVTLRLPPRLEARFPLKYRAREVWVEQCKPALETWLAQHPLPGNHEAPLFLSRVNQHERAPYIPFGPDRAVRALRRVCLEADIPVYRNHDFRHNRAFICKRDGWSSEKMRVFFGWADGSKKPDEYGRLVAADLRSDVRRSTGVNQLGQRVVASSADTKLARIAEAMRELLEERVRPER